MKDLVVLVPDKNIEQSVLGLLTRPQSIGIRQLQDPIVIVHPHRDPGVYNTGHALVESYINEARFALIILDRAWDGAPSNHSQELADKIEADCRSTWGNRARCVCIDPEIEIWVWSDSPHVPRVLCWDTWTDLRTALASKGFWPEGHSKPNDPKAAFQWAAKSRRVVPSSALFGELARNVSLSRCNDLSFLQLLRILRDWFPMGRPDAKPNS